MTNAARTINLPRANPDSRPAVVRYAVAVGLSLAAMGFRMWLSGTLAGRFVFMPLLPAMVLSAWYGGLGAGLMATALMGVVSGYVLLSHAPIAAAGGRPAELVNWLFFVLMGVVISFVVDRLNSARAAALAAAAAAREAEESVRQSEERLRLALEAGKLGVWDWDITTGKVAWSPRVYEFHGVTPDTFDETVESFRRLIHPDDAHRVGEAIDGSLSTLAPYRIEFRVVWPSDGSLHWLWTEGRVFADASGRPVRMIGATTDITPRKLAEQERERLLASERAARSDAEHASRTKDEFLATLSHELRTPLNAILGWSQLLRSGHRAEEADFEQGLEAIERNSRMQAQLIEDLLDMSRIISGKLRLEMQRVELVPVIEAAVETVKPAADAKGIALLRQFDPDAGVAWGDPNRLQQVVWNLLSNAIKFTPTRGQVRVALRRDAGSDVQLEVSDTGSGIELGFLPHVFERFRQADASSTRKHGGLGLGLAIVRHLVELHGGTVSANSDGPGRGATFRVVLPGNTVPTTVPRTLGLPQRVSPAAPDAPGATASLAGVKVLVVDDELDARLLVQRLLEERQALVITAGSAGEAIDAFERDRPHVVISDIGMPDLDGYDLIGEIRRRESRNAGTDGRVPALALTAFAREEDRAAALRAGYQMHLAKPVEPSQLAASVAALSGRC